MKKWLLVTVWALAALLVVIPVALQTPPVQRALGDKIAAALSDKLGTNVSVGRVAVSLPLRITVDDISACDQQGNNMLRASRISATLEARALLNSEIAISSAQVFGLDASLERKEGEGQYNFQFLIDSLGGSKDKDKSSGKLRIASLVVRNGKVKFDDWNTDPTLKTFPVPHLMVSDLSAHLLVNTLDDGKYDLNIKKIGFSEAHSGLSVEHFSTRLQGDSTNLKATDFKLNANGSRIVADHLKLRCNRDEKGWDINTLTYSASSESSRLTSSLADAIFSIANIKKPTLQIPQSNIPTLDIAFDVDGDSRHVDFNRLSIVDADKTINVKARGRIKDLKKPLQLSGDYDIDVTQRGLENIGRLPGMENKLPSQLLSRENIGIKAHLVEVANGTKGDISLNSDIGNARFETLVGDNNFRVHATSEKINLGKLLDNKDLSTAKVDVSYAQDLTNKTATEIKGEVENFGYKGYSYKKANADVKVHAKSYSGNIAVDDPNAKLRATFDIDGNKALQVKAHADVDNLNPHALHLTTKWQETTIALDADVNTMGDRLDALMGEIRLSDIKMTTDEDTVATNELLLSSTNENGKVSHLLVGDMARVAISGKYDVKTLLASVSNQLLHQMPTLPGLKPTKTPSNNNFQISAEISETKMLSRLLELPLACNKPVYLYANIDDRSHQLDFHLTAADFTYDDQHLNDVKIDINTPNDSLFIDATARLLDDNSDIADISINAKASDNHLASLLTYHNQGELPLKLTFDTDTRFFLNDKNQAVAQVDVHPSQVNVGDSIWNIEPSNIVYSKNDILFDHFQVSRGNQHLTIDGRATASPFYEIQCVLKDCDVEYLLKLVQFDAVSFSGLATGEATIAGIFGNPNVSADIEVADFKFEGGRMGRLYAKANYNNEEGQIDIDATARESSTDYTLIKGFVSPTRNEIDLDIDAHNSNAEFVQSYTNDFLNDIQVKVNGHMNVVGPLKQISLLGKMRVDGKATVPPLNTQYTLSNDTVDFLHNAIVLRNDTISDKYGNKGVINGRLTHNYIKNFAADITVSGNRVLAYDWPTFGDDVICGTIFASGNANIKSANGETVINVDVTPLDGSVFSYNASSPDVIADQTFINWRDAEEVRKPVAETAQSQQLQKKTSAQDEESTGDLHLNLLIHATPQAALNLLMDQQTGDYIQLCGNGTLSGSYYNKGSFDLFGNYVVDHGVYKLTIQNVIKKDFVFQPGGTISFGGDPYKAPIDLQAMYTVSAVSLSDLNIGNSFANNNVRVNCLMNITGTPETPKVDFSFDLPTVGADAKQMVYNLFDSQQEINQQVLYLLAIGRFFNINSAMNGNENYSQTTLAMQSILSGTISQQINNVLSTFIKNNNWNLGANISTGDEGFNNAQYEGLLSGRMLNDRLIFNGEFGYRDNPNATSTFIGDFDLRYQLLRNGNIAIKVYNQTNDRYFTKNSLNTQGIGLILKKDFNTIGQLLRFK